MPVPANGYTATRAMVTMELITGSGRVVDVGPWEGDVSISGIVEGYKDVVDMMDRGAYSGAVYGDDTFPEISVTIRHQGRLTSAAKATISDTILRAGKVLADGDVTTDPEGQVWHLGARITVTAPDGVDVIYAPNARPSYDYSSGDKNTIALKLTAKRDATGADPISIT